MRAKLVSEPLEESKKIKKKKLKHDPHEHWRKHVESIRGMLKDTSSKIF